MSQSTPPEHIADARHDFDFLFGKWNIHNRRLHQPLTGSNDWYEFDSTATESPLLLGTANIEHYDAPVTPNGPIHAIALRLYNATSRQWSIYWSTAGTGSVEIPTVGTFVNGLGTFVAAEEFRGTPILVRFTWTHSAASSTCRWEQAFSTDDGGSWEVNWTMDFTKMES